MNDIIDVWHDDKLGRREDAELIRRFMTAQLDIREKIGKPRTFVLNLDSQWGGGKTFFLTRFKKDLESKGHIVATVNAWKDDHLDDPLIAVVSAIKESLTEHLKDKGKSEKLKPFIKNAGLIATKSVLGWAKQSIKNQIGEDEFAEVAGMVADQTLENIGGNVLKGFEKQQDTIASFRKDLEKLTAEVLEESGKAPPLFVLIDELDRCRPDYAIKLLERIKHLFSVENIVFVVATDTGQLSNAVSGAYGSNFDGNRYLKRFFDRSYHFADASKADFIAATFDELGMEDVGFSNQLEIPTITVLEWLCNLPDIQLRDIRQMMERLQTFTSIWPHIGTPIDLLLLFPMIYQVHTKGYDDDVIAFNKMHETYVPTRDNITGQTKPVKLVEIISPMIDIAIGKGEVSKNLGEFTSDLIREQKLTAFDEKRNVSIRFDELLGIYPKLLQQLAKLDDTTRDEV